MSLSEGRRLVPQLIDRVSARPQVEAVLSQLGRPEDGTDATLTNNLELFVKLKSPDQWPRDTPALEDVIRELHHAVSVMPGLEVNFSQPIRDNVNESISGQFGQISVKLYGEDLVALQRQAERVKGSIARVTGVADLGIVKSGEVPQIRLKPDRVALARHGIDLAEFQRFFQTATGGRPVSVFWEGERRFDVVMRLPIASRDDVEKLRRLRVPTEDGTLVPVSELAEVSVGFGRASINRENGRRYIGLRMNVRGRDLGSFVDEARARVAADAPLEAGMQIEWGGEFENKERAMKRLASVVPFALLLTLLLLFQAFGAMSRAALTLLTVPFALTGGVFGLWLFEMPLSVAAAVGFIALIGQASLNGVLVMSSIAEYRADGDTLDDAIVDGAVAKLRPVLMTALLAALGLVPAATSRGIGSETQRPLAVVIVFGTLSAGLITLVVLPVLYRVYEGVAARFGLAPEPMLEH